MGWGGAIVLIAIRLFYLEASPSRSKAKDGALIFRAAAGVRLLFGGGIIGFCVLIINGRNTEEWWVLSSGVLFVILWCLFWPSTITLDGLGVSQYAWWRRVRSIPWHDVSGIERSASGEIQVFGKQGQIIGFTRFHVDPQRFLDESIRRAGLESVMDASKGRR